MPCTPTRFQAVARKSMLHAVNNSDSGPGSILVGYGKHLVDSRAAQGVLRVLRKGFAGLNATAEPGGEWFTHQADEAHEPLND